MTKTNSSTWFTIRPVRCRLHPSLTPQMKDTVPVDAHKTPNESQERAIESTDSLTTTTENDFGKSQPTLLHKTYVYFHLSIVAASDQEVDHSHLRQLHKLPLLQKSRVLAYVCILLLRIQQPGIEIKPNQSQQLQPRGEYAFDYRCLLSH